MKSVWSDSVNIDRKLHLEVDISCDVVVVGAGMAGILIAHNLSKKGVDVVVLEAREIAGGMTKNTTAKITSQHSLIYNKLIHDYGEKKASQYFLTNEIAISRFMEIIKAEKIECDFEEKDAFVYSIDDAEKINNEVRAVQKLGGSAEYISELELPFKIAGAIKFTGQAQFNPLKFIAPIAKKLQIYENTMVTHVEKNVVFTEHAKVTARKIVIASHFPFINFPGFYFSRMHQERSYVIALENAMKLNGMYIDADEKGFSFRSYGDLLLLGGAGHRTGKNKSGGCYEKLRLKGAKLFPDSVEKYHWSAQDCMTHDEIPYIGQFSKATPEMYVATGFNKWGMTTSMASAMILSDMIMGYENENAEVFSPQRFNPPAGAKNLIKDSTQAVEGLALGAFKIPFEKLEKIEAGHAGIVEHDGHRIGVYKDENGATFAVSTKCPHLGCLLEWNPDELSWDCPCHGSRFNYRGKLISNPSIKELKYEQL